MALDCAEEYVFWLKAIYLFPKKPSLIHWLKIPCLVVKFGPDTGLSVYGGFIRPESTFWLLKEKGTFLLKLLFASFSHRMIWFGLLE